MGSTTLGQRILWTGYSLLGVALLAFGTGLASMSPDPGSSFGTPVMFLPFLGAVAVVIGCVVRSEERSRERARRSTDAQNTLVDDLKAYANRPLVRFGHLAENNGVLGIAEDPYELFIVFEGGYRKILKGSSVLGCDLDIDAQTVYTTKGGGYGVGIGPVAVGKSGSTTREQTVVRRVDLVLRLDSITEPMVRLPMWGVDSAETWRSAIEAMIHRAQSADTGADRP